MAMALDSWLTKVRSAMSSGAKKKRSSSVGILAFEVGSLMSKLVHMWRAVGDAAMARLQQETIQLDGVRKVVSDDEEFLLGLACAELVDALGAASESIAALALRCADPSLRRLVDTRRHGHGHGWAASSWKEMDARARKMEKLVASTTALRRAMEELAEAEHGLRRLLLQQSSSSSSSSNGGRHRRGLSASKISMASEQQQLVFAKQQEVKQLKQTSIWGCTLDAVVASMATAAFTTLARINLVFNNPSSSLSCAGDHPLHRSPLYRSLTLSSAVHPSSVSCSSFHGDACFHGDGGVAPARKSLSMDITGDLSLLDHHQTNFRSRSRSLLTPPPGTLGADALAPRYAAVVISIERMARSPRLVGPDERDELYGMLTATVRAQLRARLRGAVPAADPGLAAQWRAALAGILDWLAPMAHATMRWQAERSFEHRNAAGSSNVLLLQTLHFADRDKVEAALAELLVGLNYVWRFHKGCPPLFAVHRHLMFHHQHGTLTSCAS